MAIGDTKSAVVSLTNASSYFIKPDSGQEWIVHNIWHSLPLYVSLCTSTTGGFFKCNTLALTDGAAWEQNLVAHLTNSIFLVLVTNSAQTVAWDGMQSK